MSLISEKAARYKSHLLALAGGVLFCSVVVLGVNQVTSRFRPVYPSQGKRELIGELVASSRVCQTFTPQYNDLNRIDVMLSDYGRKNKGPFVFQLRRTPDDEQAMVTLMPDASAVAKADYTAFEFPPIPNSAGQTLAFCLEAPEAELANSITAVGILADTYPDGEAIFRDMWGQSAGISDLDFRLGYAFSAWERLIVFSERLTQHKPLVCGDWRFYAVLGVCYLVLLNRLMLKLGRQTDSEQT